MVSDVTKRMSSTSHVTSMVDLSDGNLHDIFVNLPLRTQAMCRMTCTTFNNTMGNTTNYSKVLFDAMRSSSKRKRIDKDADVGEDIDKVYSPIEVVGLTCHGNHGMRGWDNVLKKWRNLPNLAFLLEHFAINLFTRCFSSHRGLMFVACSYNLGAKGFVCNPLTRKYVELNNITHGYEGRHTKDTVVLRAWENGDGFTLYVYKMSWTNGVGLLAFESNNLDVGATALGAVPPELELRTSGSVGDPVIMGDVIYCLQRIVNVQQVALHLVSYHTSSNEWRQLTRDSVQLDVVATANVETIDLVAVADVLWIVTQSTCSCSLCKKGGRLIGMYRYASKDTRFVLGAHSANINCGSSTTQWPTNRIWAGPTSYPYLSVGTTTICFARCALDEPAEYEDENFTSSKLVIHDVIMNTWSEENIPEIDLQSGMPLLKGNFQLTATSC